MGFCAFLSAYILRALSKGFTCHYLFYLQQRQDYVIASIYLLACQPDCTKSCKPIWLNFSEKVRFSAVG